MKKIIGIIGGMGPLATADLFEKIIRATDAARDQDFPHVIVDCNTDIPRPHRGHPHGRRGSGTPAGALG